MPNRKKTLFKILPLLLLMLLFSSYLLGSPEESKQASLASIEKAIKAPNAKKDIKEVLIDDGQRIITIDYAKKRDVYSYYTTNQGTELLQTAEKQGVKTSVTNTYGAKRTFFDFLLGMLFPLLIIGVLIWYMVTSMGGLNRGKTPVEVPATRFSDLAGVDEAIQDLGEITEFLQDAERFRASGAKAPKGLLLVGPPGTGKTRLAQAVAGEAGVPFFSVSGSDFVEKFVGTGARRVRNLFKEANKYDRSIVFIDELDAVGGKRVSGSPGGSANEHNQTVNSLLTAMDGFEASNVIVIAATNNPDSLDAALTRSGRFDRKVIVDLPDWKGIVGIFKIHTKGKPIDASVDFKALAKSSAGLSGADIANIVNEALINAVRSKRSAANQTDFMDALSTVTIGRARTSLVMTAKDREVTAWHEAGHAVVALASADMPDPSHITIVPRGISGGHTKLQEPDDRFQTKSQLESRLAMMLGGMAAEQVLLGETTQGPGSDLMQATALAQQMITKMGMGVSLSVVDSQVAAVNPQVSAQVNEQVEQLLTKALARAGDVINDERWGAVVRAMAEALIDRDTLEVNDIHALKAGETLPEV